MFDKTAGRAGIARESHRDNAKNHHRPRQQTATIRGARKHPQGQNRPQSRPRRREACLLNRKKRRIG